MVKETKKTVEVKLHQFDVRTQLRPDSKIAIFGKPGTGKTNLMYDLAKKMSDKFPIVNIFNGTEMENKAYEGVVPDTAISASYNEERLARIILRQRLLKSRNHPNPWAMTIIDDCADNPKFFKTTLFKKIFKMGRHYKHFISFLFQDALDLPRDMRGSLDYIFILRESSPQARKLIHKNYASFLTYKQFCQLLDQCTEDYRCVVIQNRESTNAIDKTYFWYRADRMEKEDVRLGSDQFWLECNKHKNPNYNEEDELAEGD